MRNDFTDMIGNDVTTEFKESNLSVSDFINSKVASGAFDIDHVTFHTVERNQILTNYYNANRNQWFAKF